MSQTNQQTYNRYKKYATDLRRYYRLPAVQTSLSVVLSLFVIGMFILLAIRPTIVTIAKLNKNISDSQQTLDQLTKKAKALAQISQEWEKIAPLTRYIDNTIPTDGPRYQALTKAMELLAKETGTQLTSMTVGDALTYSSIIDPYTGSKRTVVTMPFTLRVSGDYPATSEFLNRVITIDRLVTIESVAFAKDAKATGDKTGISINLTGSATYLADQTLLQTVLGDKEGRK